MANVADLDMSSRAAALSGTLGQRLMTAVQYHMSGVGGAAGAAQEAYRLLEGIKRDYPAEPLVDAYFGSSMVLLARDKTRPLEKMRLSNAGMKLLDGAVSARPQDLMIRLLRGKNAYELPEQYFHRTRTLIEDYTHVLEVLLRDGHSPPAISNSELIRELGEGYKRVGLNREAAAFWTRMVPVTRDPALQALLRQKLQELEGKPDVETVNQNDPFSDLAGAARTVGNALVQWSGHGKKATKFSKKSKKQFKMDREREEKRRRAEERRQQSAKKGGKKKK